MYKNFMLHSNLRFAPFILPLILLPLFGEWLYKIYFTESFNLQKEYFLSFNILYIVIIRFALLDAMLFLFTRSSRHSLHITLIRIVGLYLEITLITIFYFALLFYIFDVFALFQYNAGIGDEQLSIIEQHDFLSALYISTVVFTSLGLGDWVPQSINAMMAVSAEVILGVVQAAVFMAIVIYAHQNKEILAASKPS